MYVCVYRLSVVLPYMLGYKLGQLESLLCFPNLCLISNILCVYIHTCIPRCKDNN